MVSAATARTSSQAKHGHDSATPLRLFRYAWAPTRDASSRERSLSHSSLPMSLISYSLMQRRVSCAIFPRHARRRALRASFSLTSDVYSPSSIIALLSMLLFSFSVFFFPLLRLPASRPEPREERGGHELKPAEDGEREDRPVPEAPGLGVDRDGGVEGPGEGQEADGREPDRAGLPCLLPVHPIRLSSRLRPRRRTRRMCRSCWSRSRSSTCRSRRWLP